MDNLPNLALSIRQPWVWAILHAGKDIENRSWPTRIRGRICIHAATRMTEGEVFEFDNLVAFDWGITAPEYEDLPRGGIVGTVEIVGCVKHHPSRWMFGPWGFVLRNPQPVPFIPCKGRLNFFDWRASR